MTPVYLPWLRAGLAGAVHDADPLTGELPSRATFRATATVTANPAGAGSASARSGERSVDVAMLGPGDVRALHPGSVARTDPSDGAVDVEPNYFVVAELTVPDLPWMFTPAAPRGDRLRPFVVLVVVPDGPCSLEVGAPGGRAVLHVDDASRQLPDLAQSFAWVHAQVSDVATLTGERPGQPGGLARLMCPRLLTPRTRYIAAVVPAFEPGRLAGLGLPVAEAATMRPAWDVAVADPVDLPAYHSWRFATGEDGDFEALVSRLARVRLGGDATAGRVGVVQAQPGLPALGDWRFPGALGQCADPAPDAGFVASLTDLVDGVVTADGVPLAPPFYGGRHAAAPSLRDPGVPAAGGDRTWLTRLNTDPRYRATAALGTRLVHDHQETLMAAAWAQVGAVEQANALLRQAQTARHAATAIHGRLAELDAARLLLVAGPALPRLLDGATSTTVAATVAGSRVPGAMLSGAMRRLLRPRGPLARRAGTDAGALLRAVDDGVPVVPPRPRPAGLVTVDADAPDAIDLPAWCSLTPEALRARARTPRPPASAAQWKELVGALAVALEGNPPCTPATSTAGPVPLDHAREVVLEGTVPAVTIASRVDARVGGPAGWAPSDPLTPILAAPRIDTPLARDLVALSPELLLPGMSGMPAESVAAVRANPRFIEALMVGANEALLRELVWRGYPTDLRGTPLRRFWDRRGSAGGPRDDLPAIDHTWSGDLGSHLDADVDVTVLLLRGEVLRRYPDLAVYAQRARWDGAVRVPVDVPALDLDDPAHPQRHPVFSGLLPPDLTFLGFDLPGDPRGDPDPAAADPGWFFVLQQPATRLRFGLDARRSDRSPGQGAADLSWPAVARTASGHVDLAAPLSDVDLAGWGLSATSADVAQWCEQRPFRICLHASDLLPPDP